jgi:hypothetical protein
VTSVALWCSALCAVLVLTPIAGASAQGSSARTARVAGVHVIGDALHDPGGIASDGTDLWIANGPMVSEYAEATGARVRNIWLGSALASGGVVVDGTHLWTLAGSVLVETSKANGARVATITLPDQFGPDANGYVSDMTSNGADVWLVNPGLDELTGVTVARGLVQTITSSNGLLQQPTQAVSVGSNLWVVEQAGVQEFSEATGTLVRSLTITGASGITAAAGDVWVTAGQYLIELSGTTGTELRRTATRQELLGGSSGLVVSGGNVWALYYGVPNTKYIVGSWHFGAGLAEVSCSTGRLVRRVTSPRYGFDDDANGVVAGGGRIWVLDPAVAGALIELSASSAAKIVAPTTKISIDLPAGVGVDASHVWVANDTKDVYPNAPLGSITEFSAVTGRQVGVLYGPNGSFGVPTQLIDSGRDVWVLGLPDGSGDLTVTEIDGATGAYLHELRIPDGEGPQQLTAHAVMTLSEGRLFVLNAPCSIIEYDATTGAHLADLGCSRLELPGGILALASDSGRVFVGGIDRLTTLDARSGHVLHAYAGSAYDFSSDDGGQSLEATGGHLWSSRDATGNHGQSIFTLTQYNETTGVQLRVLTEAELGIYVPVVGAVSVSGGSLWLDGALANHAYVVMAVMERSATTGALVATFDGPAYGFDLDSPPSTNGPFVALGFRGTEAWGAEGASLTQWRS